MAVIVAPNTGKIGYNPYRNVVRKFGRNSSLSNTQIVVWDGNADYDGFLNVTEEDNDLEEYVSIVSTSDEDKAGGTGATAIIFTGQGADGVEKIYYLALNGTTPVTTAADTVNGKFQCIYTAQVIGQSVNLTGATKSNIGTITISSATSGHNMAIVRASIGRTHMALWRCPSDMYATIKQVTVFPAATQKITVDVRYIPPDSFYSFSLGEADFAAASSPASMPFPFPEYIAPGGSIYFTAIAGAAGAACSVQFFLEKRDGVLNS